MARPLGLAGLLLLIAGSEACSRPTWSLQASVGAAVNLTTPLTIRQDGEPDLRLRARYRSRSFQFPLYYAVRLTRWDGDGGWAMELRHHKLYLRDPPPQVQEFAISHGYNLVTLCRLWRGAGLVTGLGAGAVVAHPENVIRGRRLGSAHGLLRSGYVLAGPTSAALVGREIPLGAGFSLPLEAAATASLARVPVAGGSADVPNLALHGTVGLSYRLP